MNYNKEGVLKAIVCSPLLPPPGDIEVKRFAGDWLELTGEMVNNPDCLYCGYPRRGDGNSCLACYGTFPCCKSSRKEASDLYTQVEELREQLFAARAYMDDVRLINEYPGKELPRIGTALREIEKLEGIVKRARELQEPDTWHWLGDGNDDLDSMGEGMIIKIRAGDLRQMLIKISWNA